MNKATALAAALGVGLAALTLLRRRNRKKASHPNFRSNSRHQESKQMNPIKPIQKTRRFPKPKNEQSNSRACAPPRDSDAEVSSSSSSRSTSPAEDRDDFHQSAESLSTPTSSKNPPRVYNETPVFYDLLAAYAGLGSTFAAAEGCSSFLSARMSSSESTHVARAPVSSKQRDSLSPPTDLVPDPLRVRPCQLQTFPPSHLDDRDDQPGQSSLGNCDDFSMPRARSPSTSPSFKSSRRRSPTRPSITLCKCGQPISPRGHTCHPQAASTCLVKGSASQPSRSSSRLIQPLPASASSRQQVIGSGQNNVAFILGGPREEPRLIL